MPATRNQLLARLHCIKKEQGWDDDTYRDILYARTGKRSAAELEGPELARAVAALGCAAKGSEVGAGDTAAESVPARDIHAELTLAALHREVAK